MAVTNDHVAGLRAFLTDDAAEYNRLFEGAAPVDADPAFSVLVAAAFHLAVRERFSASSPTAEITRFVSATRAEYGENARELDPLGAERLIKTALGDKEAGRQLDDSAKLTQVPLLRQLIVDQQLDEQGLVAFLEQARDLAERLQDSLNRPG